LKIIDTLKKPNTEEVMEEEYDLCSRKTFWFDKSQFTGLKFD